jgi:TolB-like protein/Flp pilus assembly protein TadD
MTDAPTERDDEGGWAKLRRRKVVQWGIAYAAGAWVLLQVIGFLADAFHWPDVTKQLATIALAFGLPVALVLAWYHGDRGHQRVTGAELAVLTLLLLLGGGAVWLYGHRTEPSDATRFAATPTPGPAATATTADTRPSVAVLPFVNLSSDPANEYLADGIADTLLTMLSQVSDLKVIARTSSFSFKGKNEDVRTIGRLLGVGAVLEGSVQRANDRLRITTQLINTSDGAHLWAETYDRPADDIFKVQDEIAASVTQALAVALAGKHGPGSIGTTNVAAYDAYLRGRAHIAERQSRTIAEAVANLEKAVALDPSFGRAWAELSEAYRLSSRNVGSKTIGKLPPEQAAAQQDRAARRAVEVAPDLGLAHAVLSVALMDSAPSDASLASARAVSLSPDDPDVLANRGFVLRAVEHKPDAAVEMTERAVTLDPRNARRRISLGMALDQAGDLKGALNQYREAMRMEPGYVRPYSIIGDTLAMLVGRLDSAARFLRHAEVLDPGSADIKYMLAMVYGSMGETRLREEKLRELRELGARHVLQWDEVHEAYYNGSWEEARAGVLKHLAQDPEDDSLLSFLSAVPGSRAQTEKALQMFLAADPERSKALEPGDSGEALICLLARAGDPGQAQALTRRWEPYWRKLHAGGWIAEGARYDGLARSLACAGRNEDALTELEALVQDGLDIGWRDLAVDAAYDAIRNDPRFRAVSDKLRAAETEAAARFRARPDLNDADIDSLGT